MVHFHHLAVENSGPEDQGQLRPELSGHHVFFFLGCGCDAEGVTGRKNALYGMKPDMTGIEGLFNMNGDNGGWDFL